MRSNVVWTFMGSVVYAASAWAALIILAKALDPDSVGQFTLGLAVTTPIFLFSQLQLRQLQATDAAKEFLFRDYLGLRLITTGSALGLAFVIAILIDVKAETKWVIGCLAIGKAFDSLVDAFFGRWQQQEQMHRIAKAMMVNGTLSVGLVLAATFITESVVASAISWAAASAITLLVMVVPRSSGRWPPGFCRESRPLRIAEVVRLFHTALPLGIGMLFLSLNAAIPRYLLAYFEDDYSVGIYAGLSYITVSAGVAISAIGQATSPRLAKLYAAGELEAFVRIILVNIGLGVALVSGLVIAERSAGSRILEVVYSSDFGEHSDLLLLLIVASFFSFGATFLGFGLTAARMVGVQAPLFGAVTVVTMVSSWLLIPQYGLAGAAWASLVSSCALCLACIGAMARLLGRALGRT